MAVFVYNLHTHTHTHTHTLQIVSTLLVVPKYKAHAMYRAVTLCDLGNNDKKRKSTYVQ
jgi:hypothetical protein